ncbi:hypothetical protein D3C79_286780 [compost metagenome]
MKNSDMPAMPFEIVDEVQSSRWWSGMTKREMMAMNAMQGLCSHSGDYHQPEHLAMDAVMFADALLAELERTK